MHKLKKGMQQPSKLNQENGLMQCEELAPSKAAMPTLQGE
jgi:hypothetical protein